jgi:hypothetical protein
MGNWWLLAAGLGSLAVVGFHVAAAFSPRLQRGFGAPESLIEKGPVAMGAAALVLAGVFAAWAAYAFSGAGLLPRAPLLGPCLLLIGAIYTARGMLLLPELLMAAGAMRARLPTDVQRVGSSAVSLAIGLAYLVGTIAGWTQLSA